MLQIENQVDDYFDDNDIDDDNEDFEFWWNVIV